MDLGARVLLQVGSDILLTIAGNKLDLERQRVVSRQEAADYAESVGAQYHETSAKLGKGVHDVFSTLGRRLVQVRSTRRAAAATMDSSGRSAMVLLDDEQLASSKSGCC